MCIIHYVIVIIILFVCMCRFKHWFILRHWNAAEHHRAVLFPSTSHSHNIVAGDHISKLISLLASVIGDWHERAGIKDVDIPKCSVLWNLAKPGVMWQKKSSTIIMMLIVGCITKVIGREETSQRLTCWRLVNIVRMSM